MKHFKKAALLTLLQNGVSQHEIARKTRVDRKTIRKYQAEFKGSAGGISNSPMATGFLPTETSQGPPAPPPAVAPVAVRKSSVSACFAQHDWIAEKVPIDRKTNWRVLRFRISGCCKKIHSV